MTRADLVFYVLCIVAIFLFACCSILGGAK
jgi:hypothetical protein